MSSFELAVWIWVGGAVIASLILGRICILTTDDDIKAAMIFAGIWPVLVAFAGIMLVIATPLAPLYGGVRFGMYIRARHEKKA